MSQRRMFSPDIVDSDAFLDMPQTSQLLYFHLAMRADDDGFVSPKKIMRLVGAGEDDLKVLLTKRFVLAFQSGVIVIKHWLIHNLIRKDRYKETRYLEEKNQLIVKENGSYTELATNGLPNGNQMAPQVRLGKVRLGKVNNTSKEVVAYGDPQINQVILFLRERIGGSPDGSAAENRRFAKLLLDRMKKDYPDKDPVSQICSLIDYGIEDKFHGKNITSFRYLYYNAQKIIASVKGDQRKVVIIQ